MGTKTQKITEELHKALKRLAAEEGRSLQEVTEELLRDGLQERGIETDSGATANRRRGGGKEDH